MKHETLAAAAALLIGMGTAQAETLKMATIEPSLGQAITMATFANLVTDALDDVEIEVAGGGAARFEVGSLLFSATECRNGPARRERRVSGRDGPRRRRNKSRARHAAQARVDDSRHERLGARRRAPRRRRGHRSLAGRVGGRGFTYR